MDHKEFVDERWLVSNSAENSVELQNEDEDEDEDEEEALSLSDLPLIHQWRKENQNNDDNNNNDNNSPATGEGGQDQEFDFCSFSRESEMCAADEVFFKGRILPLRHSVSSEKGLLQNYDGGGGYWRRSISRSDSMDHYYSSRSSSIGSSRQSSTSSGSGSGSSSSTAAAAAKYKPKLPPRIQFHSHPSPSPRLHNRHGGAAAASHRNPIQKSSIWNVLRLGLVTAPPAEITFRDLKARSTNSGSRNSTSSNSSSTAGNGGASKKKKMRPRILSGGGCRCAADAVDTAAPRVVIIKRSASESESDVVALHDRNSGEKLRKKQAAKKHLSQNRTFEWLKQLSVEGANDQS